MNIIVERDSVCMGDDCLAPHSRKYKVGNNATYIDLFECLKKDNYLPCISGNNVVWVLTNEQYHCIFSYFTKTNRTSMELAQKQLKNICKNSPKLKFKYFSSPQKWKESIYHMCNNDEDFISKNGWKEEIEYCDFLMNL